MKKILIFVLLCMGSTTISAQETVTNRNGKELSVIGGSGTTNYISKFTAGQTLGNSQLFDNGTNVGIGTATPAQKLDVSGSIRFSGSLMPGGLSGTSGDVLTSAGAGVAPTWKTLSSSNTPNIYTANGSLTGNRTVTQAANNLTFSSSTGNLIFSQSISGKVGIGTTSPAQLLDVNGTGLFRAGNDSGSFSNNQILFSYNTSANFMQAIKTRHSSAVASDNAIDFFTWKLGDANGALPAKHVMSLLGNGNVGVGTTSPLTNLHINSALLATKTVNADATAFRISRPTTSGVKWDNIAQFNLGSYSSATTDATSRLDLALNDGATVATVPVMTWNANGNVGIGSTAPTQALDVVGNVKFSKALMPNNSAGTAGQVLTSAGAGVAPTWATVATTVSNTVTGNGLTTTVNGVTGTSVTVPNIYTTNSTLTGARTVTQDANSLTFASTDGNFIYNPTGTGKMGIGTTAPATRLDIISPTTDLITGGSTARIYNAGGPVVGNFAGIQFKSSNLTGYWKIGANQESTSGADQNFHFLNTTGAAFASKMALAPAGVVWMKGYGTASPVTGTEVKSLSVDNTGKVIEMPVIAPFTINVATTKATVLGQTKATLIPESYNVLYPPLTWALHSFSGHISSPSIDGFTGIITYNVPLTIVNGGVALVTIKATDAIGQVAFTTAKLKTTEAITDDPLACNGDLIKYSNELATNKLNLFAKTEPTTAYTDVAGTTQVSATGDPVNLLKNANGIGGLRTWLATPSGTGANTVNAPTYNASSANFNKKPTLSFSSSNFQSLGIVTGNGSGAFKLIALVAVSSGGGNATVVSAITPNELGANGAITGSDSGSWQVSKDDNEDRFILRLANNFTTKDVNPNADTTKDAAGEIAFCSWTKFADGKPHLIVVDYDGTKITGYFDGEKIFVGTPSVQPTGNQFRIGINRAGASVVSMEMAEIIIGKPEMTKEDLYTTQAYLLCKYGLDSSLLANATSSFVLDEAFYGTASQFRLQTFSDGSKKVYDSLNNTYYNLDNVPAPGLGYLSTPVNELQRPQMIADIKRVGTDMVFTMADGSTYTIPVN